MSTNQPKSHEFEKGTGWGRMTGNKVVKGRVSQIHEQNAWNCQIRNFISKKINIKILIWFWLVTGNKFKSTDLGSQKCNLALWLYICVSCPFLYSHWILCYFSSTISQPPFRKPLLSVSCASLRIQSCLKIIIIIIHPFFSEAELFSEGVLFKYWFSHFSKDWLLMRITLTRQKNEKHFLLFLTSSSLASWKSLIINIVLLHFCPRNQTFSFQSLVSLLQFEPSC